ncbi:SDR family NAD(P)-dependent oxidoreductase [Novosphingobium taihuense]|uniref:NAD(P)-dependent dehydrogenase (Short-subunit alcohol dehydrogenase family) n=2 Tax=Novosphingobium taihuense TaxID=260085 RepID=A0A7W7AAM8_9SPHN|nr:SDR family NAD(P)-dependent oxidoreductase [Novosphingobium taihuense]MBB4613498.1 NAD(P)-dependent dehydrogenase (short-subunit alcohol dehydrogenase family) [Novosphingobium taihuense]
MRFDGRVVIVTGAGRSLGREHALLFGRRGAKVVVNDLGAAIDGSDPSDSPAAEVVEAIRAEGGIAEADYNDVSTEAGVQALVGHAVSAFGGVDILVSNAGTIAYDCTPDKLHQELFDKQLSLMVSGVGLLVGAAWPHLLKSDAGRIVLTSSAGGVFGIPGSSTYGAAKGGVIGLLRCLAIDGEPHGIKINAICPLAMSRLFSGFSDNEAFNNWYANTARPEYVAPLVAYLSHPDCEPTGRVFSSGMGHVSEIFTGLTQGWKQPGHSIEDIRDNFSAITDRNNFSVPATALESTALMFADAPLA